MTQPYRQPEVELGELLSLLAKEFKPKTDQARDDIERAVRTLAEQALAQTMLIGTDVIKSIKAIIAQLDHVLTEQINPILHHQSFQELEGTWRGLWFLCSQPDARDMVSIKVLNTTKRELAQDARAGFFESTLVRRIYIDEAATPTGAPYGALLADFDFGPDPNDFDVLGRLADIGQIANVLAVGAASPALFGLASYGEIAQPTRLALTPEASVWWSHLRNRNAARFVSLALPRVLMRAPHQQQQNDDAYSHPEDTWAHHQFLWARAVWVIGDAIVRSFIQDGWFANVSGGKRENAGGEFPRHALLDDNGGTVLNGPTESPISYAREKELAELGFTPVVESVDGRVVVNLTLTPYQDESLDRTGIRRAHTGFAADLRGLLCACQFAHGIARLAPRSSERVLQNWLDSYVALPGRLPDAARPLRAASVHLEQVHNKTFSGVAALSIWPAHQFDASEPLDLSVRIEVLYPRPTETEESFPADPTAASRAEVNNESHQPFQLLSAAPCRESHAALEAFWRSLDETALPQCQMAFAPLTVESVVDATRPIEELVEWVCREDWRLDIEIADAPHGAALDLPRLGFLVRYPSGIVRGLAAEIESVEGRYRLTIVDPLALLDPGGLVPTRPTEPLSCRFDVLVLEATGHDQT